MSIFLPPVAGSGTTRNTHTHSTSGALSITRAAADQYTTVTVNEDVTGFTDNLSDGDLLRLVLVNGTANDYTMDLSSIPTLDDPTTDLSAAIDAFETFVIAVLLEKIEGQIYAAGYNVLVAGAAQPVPGINVAESLIEHNTTSSTLTLAAAPPSGNRIILGTIIQGATPVPSPTYVAPTNGNTVNEVDTFTSGNFEPQVRIWETTGDGTTDAFTFGASNANGQTQFIVVADEAGSAVRISANAEGVDPSSVASVAAGSLILAVYANHEDDAVVTSGPAGYTLIENNTTLTEFRTGAIAALTQAATGTADPGAFTVTNVGEDRAFTIVIDA